MKLNGIKDIFKFFDFLRSKKITYSLHDYGDDAITVFFTLVGCRVEFEFFEDHIEFSYFTGDEGVFDDWAVMERLLNEHWSDD